MVQRGRLGNNALLKSSVVGVDHIVLTTLLCEIGVVVMRVMMLMLWLQSRINRALRPCSNGCPRHSVWRGRVEFA